MTDSSADRAAGLSSPPSRAFAIIPNDGADLPRPIRGLMVATGGNVALVTLAGDTAVLPALQPGMQYAVRALRVLSAGTTATGLVGLA